MEFEWLSAHFLVEQSATPFEDAVNDRAVARLLELVRAGIHPGDRGPELLRSAIEAELDHARRTGEQTHVDLTALLLIAGADPLKAVDGVSALDLATERGHWFAALLINRWGRAPLDDPDPLPPPEPEESTWELATAIEVDRFCEAHKILAAGADVHAEVGSNSLLVQALDLEDDGYAQSGEMHLDGSALLLAMGADPWRRPRRRLGPTAAQRANERGYDPVVLLYRSWQGPEQ